MMLIWLVGAVVVILLQRFSWWTYHFNLLFVPTAALAVRGIDLALAYVDDALAERRRAVAVAVLLLVGLPLAAAVAPAAREARELVKSYKWATPQAGGEEGFYAGGWIALYQQRESPDYRRNMPMAQFLRDPSSLPGPIYVIGNPLIYLFSGRRQALPVNGWSLDWCVDALWQRLPRDIQTHRPVYIFIDEMFRSTLAERNPQVLETIGRLYTTQSVEPFGRWYRLAQP
jgi:hypothetical protein